jgi:undecaprenyl-diphosphatase
LFTQQTGGTASHGLAASQKGSGGAGQTSLTKTVKSGKQNPLLEWATTVLLNSARQRTGGAGILHVHTALVAAGRRIGLTQHQRSADLPITSPMTILQTLILGILQGITEFLPISSSAHLILVPVVTGWQDQGVAFDLAVHVGTLLAVVLYFRKDLAAITRDGALSVVKRQQVGQSRLAWAVVLGTIPTGLAGLALMDMIETTLRSVSVIVITTLVFGLLLGIADASNRAERDLSRLTWLDVAFIGLAQAISLIPGTSRSGITITAGLLLGLTREAAARFSFLLAIPITALAASLKIIELAQSDLTVDWAHFLLGGVTAFITAIIAIHFFLQWLNRFGMMPYVIYRLILGATIYFVLLH